MALLLLSLILLACQPPQAPIEPTRPAPTATPQIQIETTRPVDTAAATIALSAMPQPTRELPTSTPTALPISTSEPTATATEPVPTATATLVPSPPLTIRQPTIDELENYLDDATVTFLTEEVSISTATLENFFEVHKLTENAEVVYEDINGDGEPDLIFTDLTPSFGWGRGFLVVMLWVEDHYLTPFLVTNFTQYTLSQHITLEDWTEDKIPEIVFDFTNDTGGSGYVETTWERYIISCQENCYVVWSGMTGQIRSYYSKGLTTTNIEKTIDENGDIAIILVKESFNAPALFSHPLIAGVEATVKASVFEIYTWNGQTFEQTEQKILSPAYELESKSILTANNETGDIVFIDSVFVDDDPFLPIYNCTLVLNGEAIGLPFECDANFSTVEWIDMTNDGHPEIVVKALAFEFQHLIAFQWDGATAIQIADIMGDIVRSDLYGVRLEDVDGDGQLEILAGSGYLSEGIECNHFEGDYGRYSEVCWHELSVDDVIYKWDGASFVLWEGGR